MTYINSNVASSVKWMKMENIVRIMGWRKDENVSNTLFYFYLNCVIFKLFFNIIHTI